MSDIEELRERLRGLRESLTPAIVWAATTTADCLGESDYDPDFPDVDWCLYDAEEDDPPLASGMMRQHAIALAELINTCPAIDTALARLIAAEGRTWGQKFDELMSFPEGTFVKLPASDDDDEEQGPS